MVLARWNSTSFHRQLYAGQMERVILLKRNDDQQEGVVRALVLFECRRGNVQKTGEAINTDTQAVHSCQWVIPCIQLRAVGVNYINVCDRIVDQFNAFWQPESPQTITLSQFDQYYIVECLRVDPPPPGIPPLLGIPGTNLPSP